MYEKTGNKTAVRLLIALLAVAMVFTMMPLTMGQSHAATGMETKTPALVVTGSGLVGEAYTEESVQKEKAYTLDELKALEGVQSQMYSAMKAKDPYTKSYFIADGVKVSSLIGDPDSIKEKVTFIAEDGYVCSFLNGAEYKNGASEEALGLGSGRYFFDGFEANAKTEVPAILAWAYDSAEGENGAIPTEKPAAAKDNGGPLRVMVGQYGSPEDQNQPLFNGNSKVGINKVLVGSEVGENALTIGNETFRRADVLMKDFAENSYTYSTDNGEKTDQAKGVPISVLLSEYGPADKVSFSAADGYDVAASGMTIDELTAKNAMLAYEVNGSGIYETAKKDKTKFGHFRLYLDGQQPAKLVNSIMVEKQEQPQLQPAKPKLKSVKAGKKKATVTWSKAKNADGYVLLCSTKKKSGFKAVKTISKASTTKFTVKKLKKGKTYYFKVRSYRKDGDTKVFSEDSGVKSVKIKK